MTSIDYEEWVRELLDDSPLTSRKVIGDIMDLLNVGEVMLAFDTLCSWIHEDSLPITADYYDRLMEFAPHANVVDDVKSLQCMIVNAAN